MAHAITLLTDFGAGEYVARMKGVLLSQCPEARQEGVDPNELAAKFISDAPDCEVYELRRCATGPTARASAAATQSVSRRHLR